MINSIFRSLYLSISINTFIYVKIVLNKQNILCILVFMRIYQIKIRLYIVHVVVDRQFCV